MPRDAEHLSGPPLTVAGAPPRGVPSMGLWKWTAGRVGALSPWMGVLLVLGLVAFSAGIVFSAAQVADETVERLAMVEVETHMRVAWHLLGDFGGNPRIVGGHLMIGETVVGSNEAIVDELRDTVGGVATIFQGDEWISTTIKDKEGRLAIGRHLLKGPARIRVLEQHRSFRGSSRILGQAYYSAFDPILDAHGQQVGTLYVGLRKADFIGAVAQARFTAVVASSVCILLITVFFLAMGRHLARQIVRHENSIRQISDELERVVGVGPASDRDTSRTSGDASQDRALQRLLAGMFARVRVAVLLVRMDGSIVMSNPAAQRLFAVSAHDLVGSTLDSFMPPDCMRGVRAAWTAGGGGTFETTTDLLPRAGRQRRVRMSSDCLPATQDQKLRVITLVPEAGSVRGDPEPIASDQHAIGQVQVISLAAIKTALGEQWSTVAAQAMALAHQVIARNLGRGDVLQRNGEDGLIIWFGGTDEGENNLVLDAAIRELRLRLLVDFGEEVIGNVSAVLVSVTDRPTETEFIADASSDNIPLSGEALETIAVSRRRNATLVTGLMTEMRELPRGRVDTVIDRAGRTRPMVVVDFPVALRDRLSVLSTGSVQDVDRGADIDLMRLKLGIRELVDCHHGNDVLIPIAWQALVSPARRWAVDECLVTLDARVRKNLVLAISDVPPLPSETRWRKTIDPLRRQFGDVGPMVTLLRQASAAVQEAMAQDWLMDILVIDAADRMSAGSEKYFTLITHARKRNIGVLVRTADGADHADWRELGATMLTGGPADPNRTLLAADTGFPRASVLR